jgi:serine/threonine-protein kinase HipA
MAHEDPELLVLLNGTHVGTVTHGRKGDLTFRYEQSWRDHESSYPLSLSMPMPLEEHSDAVVRPFLEGLLPDNRDVLERWGKEFHVSSGNPFALLTHLGEDCAGAVQLVLPERVPEVLGSTLRDIAWLSEEDVSDRLRELVERGGTGRWVGDHGHFSLSGAQPKTALFYDGSRWGIPAGAVPTTHILKPPAQKDLDGFEINEHFCLKLANHLYLSAASSAVHMFGDQTAIVVQRYDRTWTADGRVVRLHQEDACQALAVSPWIKYENEGGPGAPDIVKLLLRESSDPATDVGLFLDALALNWVIAGTDVHAKNYSVLISDGVVQLAPLYDLLSALPYPDHLPYRKLKLAMRINREYRVWGVEGGDWMRLAERCDLDPDPVIQRVSELAATLVETVPAVASEVRAEGLEHGIVDRLEETIIAHGKRCLNLL